MSFIRILDLYAIKLIEKSIYLPQKSNLKNILPSLSNKRIKIAALIRRLRTSKEKAIYKIDRRNITVYLFVFQRITDTELV